MADVIFDAPIAQAPAKPSAVFRGLLHNPAILFGGTVIAIVLLMALLAPWLGTIGARSSPGLDATHGVAACTRSMTCPSIST